MIPKRPSVYSDEVAEACAAKILSHVVEWLKSNGEDETEVKSQLQDAIEHESDGYKIAKRLEDDGWDVD